MAVGNRGVSASGVLSVSVGSGEIRGGGVTAGAAVGLAAGVALTGCWTWGVSEVACLSPF